MLRQAISIGLIIVAGLMVVGAQAQDKLVLKSVNVDLPFGDRMFQGPGSEALNNNCLACHSAGMVLTQSVLSKEQWHAEVEKMLTAFPRTSTRLSILSWASSKRSSQDELMGPQQTPSRQASRQPRTIRSRAPPLHAPPDGRGAKSVADLVRMANVLGVKPEH